MSENGELSFKVNLWKNKISGVDEKLVEIIKSRGAQIESIKVKPQYKLVVGL